MLNSGLFRKEALESRRGELFGTVVIYPNITYSVIFFFLSVWFVLFIVWMFETVYAKKIAVMGWLEPEAGIIKIFEVDQGVIAEVFVKDGDKIKKGQHILAVKREKVISLRENLSEKLVHELKQQNSLLEQEKARSIKENANMVAGIQDKIKSNNDQISLLIKQKEIYVNRVNLVQNDLERYTALLNINQISQASFDQAKEKLLIVESNIGEVDIKIEALSIAVKSLENELRQSEINLQANLQSIESKTYENNSRIDSIGSESYFYIVAPADGVVANFQLRVGSRIDVNKPLLSILPASKTLVAKLLVPVKAIGSVKAQQIVNVRYDAYPYQQFGTFRGKILRISESAALSQELIDSPLQVNGSVYLMYVQLDAQEIESSGEVLKLAPGMTLIADVLIDSKSIMQWIFNPVKEFFKGV